MRKSKLNILRIVYDWPDENVITTGLSPAPYGLSIAQAKLGHKVYVLCGNLNGKNLKSKKFSYTLNNGQIKVYNLPRGLKHFGPFLTTSFFVLPYYFYLKTTKKIDLVHNQGHLGVWFLLYKFLFGWVDKTPVLGHFHITAKGRELSLKKGGIHLDFFTKFFEYPIHKFSDNLSKYVCPQVVVVSQNIKQELVTLYGFLPNRVHLLESAVDTSIFKKEGKKVDFGFSKDSKILLNLGRLSSRKNIHLIVESLKYLPNNFKLVLVGPWDKEYKLKVDSLIKKEKLEDRIKYLGVVSTFKSSSYFRSADIFVLPSSYEGLPKVVIESLASGLKVVASGFKMKKDVPNLYYLKNLNSQELAKKILDVDKKANKYKETFSIISKYYSYDSKAQELEEIYAKML